MKSLRINCLLAFMFVFLLSGCTVRKYSVVKDRVDQDLSGGNRGFIQGESKGVVDADRKTTRTVEVVEIEIGSPFKFGKAKKEAAAKKVKDAQKTDDSENLGNRGYISDTRMAGATDEGVEEYITKVEKYTVQKGDTLQKISQKFYGTTKKWNSIFEYNKNLLKAPDKIYPGQVIDIPLEGPVENVK